MATAKKKRRSNHPKNGWDCTANPDGNLKQMFVDIVQMGRIEWSVHLANKKSAWYQFQLALDIPEAASVPPSLLRNAAVADRSQLVIDPGPRHIKGINQHGGKRHGFDTGKFMGKTVYLGELRTDEAGRLIVLGGRGQSASFDGIEAVTFANNEGWHDDVSDGPVTAKVIYDGQELRVEPAWVVVAPPNYAPMQKSVRTMWDLMRDVAITGMKEFMLTNNQGYKVNGRCRWSGDKISLYYNLIGGGVRAALEVKSHGGLG